MEISEISFPAFFSNEDFIELSKFPKLTRNAGDEEHQKTYSLLKTTYAKIAYWAKEVQKNIFPDGYVSVVQKPTNQANIFEEYQWAKIYPDQLSKETKILAFTIGIDTSNRFTIKIDTVGLRDSDKRRQSYLQQRGDFDNSEIVKNFPYEQILDKGWKYLIDLSSNIILSMKPQYDDLLESFQNGETNARQKQEIQDSSIALNTILYGPPGTGKTYHTITKALEIIGVNIKNANRKTIKEEFNKRVLNGQIVFTTFHQSMSYEDFIEGIKPVKPEQSGQIHYEIQDGIFKNICIEASKTSQYTITIENSKDKLTKELFEEYYYSFSETLPSIINDKSPVILNTKEGSPFGLFKNSADSIVVRAGTKRTNQSVALSELEAVLFKNKIPTYKSYEEIIIQKILEDKGFQKTEINNTKKNYVLIIDEINRGNVAQIFGELITLIETDKREGKPEALTITLPYSKKSFSVPSNLYILGTMNTADRSVEALDTALRRRFEFEEMKPEPKLLSPYHQLQRLWALHWDIYNNDVKWEIWKQAETAFGEMTGMKKNDKKYEELDQNYALDELDQWFSKEPDELFKDAVSFVDGINFKDLLLSINNRLEALLSKDHTIGHAWLMDVYNLPDLQRAFKNKIMPLLQEYFYNDYAKIGLILGDKFVKALPLGEQLFKKFRDVEDLASEYSEKVIFKLKDPFELSFDDFKSIYK